MKAAIEHISQKQSWSEILDTDLVLRMFSENKGRARKQYVMFMNDGATVKKEDVYATIIKDF